MFKIINSHFVGLALAKICIQLYFSKSQPLCYEMCLLKFILIRRDHCNTVVVVVVFVLE